MPQNQVMESTTSFCTPGETLGVHSSWLYHARMPDAAKHERKRKAKYRRARVRHFLFTRGPDRLAGGRISRRHLSKGVEIREVEASSPNWPRAFDGLRIGHVSDFHLGDLMPVERAIEVVELLGRQSPDLVACTGDVVDLHHDDAQPVLGALASIDARYGSMLVLGNHDELHCGETLTRMAADAGLIVLRNDAVQISDRESHLLIAGIRWGKNTAQLTKHVDRTCGGQTHLLLAHNPKAFRRAVQLGIPLTLAGHTHGGQVAMKNRPGTNLALTHVRSAGLYARGESRLFVTAGVGAWFPLRVNCPAEIAIITMRHAPAEA